MSMLDAIGSSIQDDVDEPLLGGVPWPSLPAELEVFSAILAAYSCLVPATDTSFSAAIKSAFSSLPLSLKLFLLLNFCRQRS